MAGDKEQDLKAHLGALLVGLFPPQAMTRGTLMDGVFEYTASWRLGATRMDNWSKEIRIVVPGRAMERYAKLNEKGRLKADGNLVSCVLKKLEGFDPHHDRPRFLLPPVERWEVGFEELFPSAK